MKKRYLKTIEDVLALRDTDTKIYDSCYNETDTYYKYVDGVLCRFDTNGGIKFNDGVYLKAHNYYILEEEPMQEATKDDIGKLCWFENEDRSYGFFDFLEEIFDRDDRPYQPENTSLMWHHCRRATPSEVAELTGYKVEEK